MIMVVGLGNPTEKYVGTRHNIGFDVVDALAQDLKAPAFHRWKKADITKYRDKKGGDILLAKPQTYMNLSGEAVHLLLKGFQISTGSLVVIHDDMDFPLGQLRVKVGGGHGGHNGLNSIIEKVGDEFVRIRIGIGRPATGSDPACYVLSPFFQNEQSSIAEVTKFAILAVKTIMARGVAIAMRDFNRSEAGPRVKVPTVQA